MFSFYQNDSMESEKKNQTHKNQIYKKHPTP